MILRRWRGAVRAEDAEAYLTHQVEVVELTLEHYEVVSADLGGL